MNSRFDKAHRPALCRRGVGLRDTRQLVVERSPLRLVGLVFSVCGRAPVQGRAWPGGCRRAPFLAKRWSIAGLASLGRLPHDGGRPSRTPCGRGRGNLPRRVLWRWSV